MVVGLRPAFPSEGVHLILGNKLAGDRVWANVPKSPMVSSSGELVQQTMVVDPVCVVTHDMTKNAEHKLEAQDKNELNTPCATLPNAYT